MNTIIGPRYYSTLPIIITGTTADPADMVRILIDGELQSTIAVSVNHQWSYTIDKVLDENRDYTITTLAGGSLLITYITKVDDSLVPPVDVPDMDNIFPELAPADMICSAEFSSLVGDVAPSCDLMGTITALAGEIERTIRDEAGKIIGVIKESAAKVTASIKTAIGESFGGSGGLLNKLKGYVGQAKTWVSDAKSSIETTIGEFTTWASEKVAAAKDAVGAAVAVVANAINDAKATVAEWAGKFQSALTNIKDGLADAFGILTSAMSTIRGQMVEIQGVISEAIGGIALATCDALTSVLAGTPSDAFANITAIATDAATKTLATAKDIFNTGVESVSEIHERMVNSVGTGDVLDNVKGIVGSQIASIAGSDAAVTDNTTKRENEMIDLSSNPPVFAP